MSHNGLGLGEIHQIHNAEQDTRSAREAASYTANDIGKVVKQLDDNQYYLVTASTPEFNKIGSPDRTLQTTDATSTVIWSFTLSDESTIGVKAMVTGSQSTTDQGSLFGYVGLFSRNGGGSATQLGSTQTLFTAIETDSNTACEFAVSGNDVQLKVTGVNPETWNWVATVDIQLI